MRAVCDCPLHSVPTELPVERVLGSKLRKPAEVPVCREYSLDAVPDAERGNPSIMDSPAPDAGFSEKHLKSLEIPIAFVKQRYTRRFQPVTNLDYGIGRRRGWVVDPRMGDDCVEFVDTRPRQRPQRLSFRQFSQYGVCLLMPGRVGPMSVNKNVGINGNHGLTACK